MSKSLWLIKIRTYSANNPIYLSVLGIQQTLVFLSRDKTTTHMHTFEGFSSEFNYFCRKSKVVGEICGRYRICTYMPSNGNVYVNFYMKRYLFV